MSWAVLHLPGSDTAERIARSLGVDVVSAADPATHLIHLGDDASLARVCDEAGPGTPILHHPVGRSDVRRMFGERDVAELLEHGAEYPIELIDARSDRGRFVAVGHAVASSSGLLPGALARNRQIQVRRDGREHSANGAAVVIANCQHVAGFTVAPRAALMDGRIDLQVIGGSRLDRVRRRRAMRRGLHLSSRSVHRRSVHSVAFDLPKGWGMRCDGVPVKGTRWEVAVVPAAATLWV